MIRLDQQLARSGREYARGCVDGEDDEKLQQKDFSLSRAIARVYGDFCGVHVMHLWFRAAKFTA